MRPPFHLCETDDLIQIKGRHYVFERERCKDLLTRVAVFDGKHWTDVTPPGQWVGPTWSLPVVTCALAEEGDDFARITARHESASWRLDAKYEIFPRGYMVCTFCIEALFDRAQAEPLLVGVPLAGKAVFAHNYRILNMDNDPASPRSVRALSVDFSTDERPVTNSISFLLESIIQNMNGRICYKAFDEQDEYRYLGWAIGMGGLFPKGFRYENRWCLTVTGLDNGPNKVRGQRTYHWYGRWPTYPSDDILIEMSEYGCSILALHMPIFVHISGSVPHDENELQRVITRAHQLGMKVIFYCQPYLISNKSLYHVGFANSRTECLRIWHSMSDTQIVFYEPDDKYDCDEFCLRNPEVYRFIRDTVLDCYRRFGFDGLYVDWAWPPQGLCNSCNGNHKPGLFNFYDYLRILRDWRKAIGPDAIMIGHGGGFLVSSDFIEGFDARLTGEAQHELDPVTIGQQFGLAPTLWSMHRRKQDAFRSASTIENLIREEMTPHTGLGIMGTSIIATLDPGHNAPPLALWQMWRGFPVHRARFHNYLTEPMLRLDNDKVYYSLYVTEDQHVLLLLGNSDGQAPSGPPVTSVDVQLDTKTLGLPGKLNCWRRMKGNTYETFRIAETAQVINNARLSVSEMDPHEFIGFVLSPGKPPKELTDLMAHLEGRSERLGTILQAKLKRLAECDRPLDHFATLSIAANRMTYGDFMEKRVAE